MLRHGPTEDLRYAVDEQQKHTGDLKCDSSHAIGVQVHAHGVYLVVPPDFAVRLSSTSTSLYRKGSKMKCKSTARKEYWINKENKTLKANHISSGNSLLLSVVCLLYGEPILSSTIEIRKNGFNNSKDVESNRIYETSFQGIKCWELKTHFKI
jgi:hypothetical protein